MPRKTEYMVDIESEDDEKKEAHSAWDDALLRLGILEKKAVSRMKSPEECWRIVRYQRILDTDHLNYPPASKSFVSVKAFVQHLYYLKNRCQVIALPILVDRVLSGEKIEPLTVAITFDGGYVEQFTDVVPLLEHLELPATFFVLPKYLNTDLPRWPEAIMAFATLMTLKKSTLSTYPEFEFALKNTEELAKFSRWTEFELAEHVINHLLRLQLDVREMLLPDIMEAIGTELLQSKLPRTFATFEELAALNRNLFSISTAGMTGEPMPFLEPEDQLSEVLSAQAHLRKAQIHYLPYFAFPDGHIDSRLLNPLAKHGTVACFSLDSKQRKPIFRRDFAPIFPRLSLYQQLAPTQLQFIKTLWNLHND